MAKVNRIYKKLGKEKTIKWIKKVNGKVRIILNNVDLSRSDFSRADLRECDFTGVDFSRSDFTGADLRKSIFIWAGFSYSNFSEADLKECDFSEADLKECDFSEADLRECDFSEADLRECDFSGANLILTNFTGADLRGADLRGANIDFSCLPLWCGGLDFKIDEKQSRQIAYHSINLTLNFINYTKEQIDFANGFHRVLSGLPKLAYNKKQKDIPANNQKE